MANEATKVRTQEERGFGLFKGIEMTEEYKQQLAEKDAKIEKAIDDSLEALQNKRINDAYALRGVENGSVMILPLAQQEQKTIRELWRSQYEEKVEYQTEIEKAFLQELKDKDPEASKARENEADHLRSENEKQTNVILNGTLFDMIGYDDKKDEKVNRFTETTMLEEEAISLYDEYYEKLTEINDEIDKRQGYIREDQKKLNAIKEKLKEQKRDRIYAEDDKKKVALADIKNNPKMKAAEVQRKEMLNSEEHREKLLQAALKKWQSLPLEERPSIMIDTGIPERVGVQTKIDCLDWVKKSPKQRKVLKDSWNASISVPEFMGNLHEKLKGQGVEQVDWHGTGFSVWKNGERNKEPFLTNLLKAADVENANSGSFDKNMQKVFEENVILTYMNAESKYPSRVRLDSFGRVNLEEYIVPKKPDPLTGFTAMWSNFCKKLHITTKAQKQYDREMVTFESGGKMAEFYSSEASRPTPHSAEKIEEEKNGDIRLAEDSEKLRVIANDEAIVDKVFDWYLPHYKKDHPEDASIESLNHKIENQVFSAYDEERAVEKELTAEVENAYKNKIEQIENDYEMRLSDDKFSVENAIKACEKKNEMAEEKKTVLPQKYLKEFGGKALAVADAREHRIGNFLKKAVQSMENKVEEKAKTVEIKAKPEAKPMGL